MDLDDATLERFRRGDDAAFADVVRVFSPLVRSVAARYWRGSFEREEAIQEVWLHVYRHRAAVDPGRFSSVSGWIAVLAQRRCIDLLRRPSDPADAGAEDEETSLSSLGVPADQQADAEVAELMLTVERFKARLAPAWRSFFELHFVEGLDYAAIAARLRISKLRCKYMRKVLAGRARKNRELCAALGRVLEREDRHAP